MVHTGYVYKWTSPSGKIYVGQTTKHPIKRMGKNGVGYKTSRKLYHAIQKHGASNFQLEILEIVMAPTQDALIAILNTLEPGYINGHNSLDPLIGYNLQLGGKNHSVTQETRELLRAKNSGHINGNRKYKSGSEHPFYGKKHTEQAIEKIKLAQVGRVFTQETRQRISDSNKGRIVSQDTRDKISVKNTGKKRTEEQRRRVGQAHIGQKPWNRGLRTGKPRIHTPVELGMATHIRWHVNRDIINKDCPLCSNPELVESSKRQY